MEEGVPEGEKLMHLKEAAEENKDKQEEVEEEKGAKGGILNNLISSVMDATTTVDGKSGENIQNLECEDENEKEKESSNVGILEKIISHLPEDAVPTTDEAAILIHSAID